LHKAERDDDENLTLTTTHGKDEHHHEEHEHHQRDHERRASERASEHLVLQ